MEAEGKKWVGSVFLVSLEWGRRVTLYKPEPLPGVMRRNWGIVHSGGRIKLVAIITQTYRFAVQLLHL